MSTFSNVRQIFAECAETTKIFLQPCRLEASVASARTTSNSKALALALRLLGQQILEEVGFIRRDDFCFTFVPIPITPFPLDVSFYLLETRWLAASAHAQKSIFILSIELSETDG